MHFSPALLAIGFGLVLALPAAGQDNSPTQHSSSGEGNSSPVVNQSESTKPLGVVQSGNTTIVFAPADSRDIDTASLRTWRQFADEHPRVAHALTYRPSLMNDAGYLRKNPDLSEFFQEHPDIKQAMTENPGNFEAIPPRLGE